jgi:hypothetical protein
MAEFVKEKLFMRTGTKSSDIKMYSSVYLFTEKIIREKKTSNKMIVEKFAE